MQLAATLALTPNEVDGRDAACATPDKRDQDAGGQGSNTIEMHGESFGLMVIDVASSRALPSSVVRPLRRSPSRAGPLATGSRSALLVACTAHAPVAAGGIFQNGRRSPAVTDVPVCYVNRRGNARTVAAAAAGSGSVVVGSDHREVRAAVQHVVGPVDRVEREHALARLQHAVAERRRRRAGARRTSSRMRTPPGRRPASACRGSSPRRRSGIPRRRWSSAGTRTGGGRLVRDEAGARGRPRRR